MTLLTLLAQILANLPELLRLVRNIQDNLEEVETERKVKDDIQKLNEAFEAKDEKAFRDIFNS